LSQDLQIEKMEERCRGLERSLQQSEARFMKLFNLCSVPALITTARDGCVLEANRAFMEFWGYSRTELIGRTTAECGICIHPQRRQEYARLVSEKAVQGFAEQLRAKSGRIWNVWLSAVSFRVIDEVCILSVATCRE